LEELRWSPKKIKKSNCGHVVLSLTINIMDERNFQQEIPITPIFNVKVYFSYTSPLCSLCHGTNHVIGNCFYRTNQFYLVTLNLFCSKFFTESFSNCFIDNCTTYPNG
jgi:hypothetical protein